MTNVEFLMVESLRNKLSTRKGSLHITVLASLKDLTISLKSELGKPKF